MYTTEFVEVSEEKFVWHNKIEAFILYTFYTGYILYILRITDKLGARCVLGSCMLLLIITNILYPLASFMQC